MNDDEKLELFGKEIILNLRDLTIKQYLSITAGKMKSADAQNIYKISSSFNDEDKEKVDKIVLNVIDRMLHNTLRLFEESPNYAVALKSSINFGEDISAISDGLSGELYEDEGWIKTFSKYPKATMG